MGCLASCEQIRELVNRMFRQVGLTAEDAESVTDMLLDADIRGVRSHGVIRLKQYVEKICSGGADPNAKMIILRESPVSAVLNANGGLGGDSWRTGGQDSPGKGGAKRARPGNCYKLQPFWNGGSLVVKAGGRRNDRVFLLQHLSVYAGSGGNKTVGGK